MKRILLIVFCVLAGFKSYAQDVPQSERDALVAFYDALGGDLWTRIDNWKTDKPVSTWYGVTVANGHVTGLTFTNNHLVGGLPSSIGNLIFLKSLSFQYEKITSIPEEIGNLQALEFLKIDGQSAFNEFALISNLPLSLSSLSNLKDLQLPGQPITQLPANFGNLKNLYNLNLTNTLISVLPTTFSDLTSLSCFTLANNSQSMTIVLPDDFGKLNSLQNLSLNGNITSLPNSFSELNKLTKLTLYSSVMQQFPNIINKLNALQDLTLSLNDVPTSNPYILSALTNLKTLALYGVAINNLDLSSNSSLQSLSLPLTALQILNLKNGNNTNLTRSTVGTIAVQPNPNNIKCVAVDYPARAINNMSPYGNLIVNFKPGYEKNFRSDCSSFLSTNDIKISDFKISNPVKDLLTIQTTDRVDHAEIYSMTGQLVKSIKGNEANVSDLPKGVYLLKIITDKGTSTQKIIKE